MMSDLLGPWLGRSSDRAAPAPAASDNTLPADLLACLDCARVRDARKPDEDGLPRIKVRAPGLGEFRWDGIEDAAERVAALWPELSPPQCVRAAQILEVTVGDVGMARLQKRERRPWVWDW